MGLDESIASIVTRLDDWARFPKYQLERRLDIFLTPFLAEFVCAKLGGTSARLVAPEFPILAALDPDRRQRRTKGAEPAALTVNVDYLLHVEHPEGDRWIFLELKTDGGSFDLDQLRLYRIARDRGLAKLADDLDRVQGRSKQGDKYGHLKGKLGKGKILEEPIQIAYLSPEPKKGFPSERTSPETLPTVFWRLRDFRSSWKPTAHGELWDKLQLLLDR